MTTHLDLARELWKRRRDRVKVLRTKRCISCGGRMPLVWGFPACALCDVGGLPLLSDEERETMVDNRWKVTR